MRRRSFVKALVAAPAVPALVAQDTASTDELPKLSVMETDSAADGMLRFFTPAQFLALRRLSDVIMPRMDGNAGAVDAKAAEFLDFLLGESPADRQQLYRTGLDALNAQAAKRFGKAFTDVDVAQADEILAPLREPWTYDPPADPLAAFLREAKLDVRTATMNSREYGGATRGGRRAGGVYWYPLD